MSDVRALLDEVTARPVAHPDPVGAVHARVRRRAARRRAAVAAGTTCALVAGLAYAARPAGRALPPTAPGRTPAPAVPRVFEHSGPQWRLRPVSGTNAPDEVPAAVTRLWQYVLERDKVFAYFEVGRRDGAWVAWMAVGGDQDVALWRSRVEQVAGDAVTVYVDSCPYAASVYDRVKDELVATAWPSGNRLFDLELTENQMFGRCAIIVMTIGDGDFQADLRYSKRWSAAVAMIGPIPANRTEPPFSGSPPWVVPPSP